MSILKSREEKALERKLAIRQGINDLEKCNRSLNRKREELLQHAAQAKRQGIMQQYTVAVGGLKMVMSYQKRCSAMTQQLRITESMRDLTAMNTKFMRLVGDMGREVSGLTKSADFTRNQLAFEKGMLSAESAMEKLEDFMEDTSLSYEPKENSEEAEQELNREIEQMIDLTGAAQKDPMEEEIDRKLADLDARCARLQE